MRKGGLEPPWVSPPDPKSGASANSATFAGTLLEQLPGARAVRALQDHYRLGVQTAELCASFLNTKLFALYKEIAQELNVAEQTIKNHVHRMLRKVRTSDRLAVVELFRTQVWRNGMAATWPASPSRSARVMIQDAPRSGRRATAARWPGFPPASQARCDRDGGAGLRIPECPQTCRTSGPENCRCGT